MPTMCRKPWRPEVVSGVSVACGQRVHDRGGQVRGVDQLVLGPAGVDRHALDGDFGRVGREGLVDDLAQVRAVQRVGEVGLEIARQVGMHAAADLLVGREADADRAVRQVRVLQQVARRGHDDGDARLVIRAQQRRPGGGHDVVAHFLRQIGQRLGRQHLAGIVGQDDVLAVVAAMDDGLDVGAGELGGRVHVRQQGDGGHSGLHRRRDGRQDRAIVGQTSRPARRSVSAHPPADGADRTGWPCWATSARLDRPWCRS